MKILLVGGGTGGHITPLLAVAHELKRLQPKCEISIVTDKHNAFMSILSSSKDITRVDTVPAGKLRRYPNQKLISKITDVHTFALNVRDAFRTSAGLANAYKILKKTKPDIIFIKGGFVGVPVGVAARKLGIPYITHDSDTRPGLANRLIARGAVFHAVGMPEKFYQYPKEKMKYVGIPLSSHYQTVTDVIKQKYRKELSIPKDAKVVFVTGGSQGAARLNQIITMILTKLIKQNVLVIHQTGKTALNKKNEGYRHFEFSDKLYKYSAVADVVVARAGASTFAELAVQGRAVIQVPSPYLAGGHQIENARHLAEQGAAIHLEEMKLLQHPDLLLHKITELLNDTSLREKLENNSNSIARHDAAQAIANLLISKI